MITSQLIIEIPLQEKGLVNPPKPTAADIISQAAIIALREEKQGEYIAKRVEYVLMNSNYRFKRQDVLCPGCGENISKEVDVFLGDQEYIQENVMYGESAEYGDPGPVCPKCGLMVGVIVKHVVMVVQVEGHKEGANYDTRKIC
jgi:hypothetical protein